MNLVPIAARFAIAVTLLGAVSTGVDAASPGEGTLRLFGSYSFAGTDRIAERFSGNRHHPL